MDDELGAADVSDFPEGLLGESDLAASPDFVFASDLFADSDLLGVIGALLESALRESVR
ncbi:MAG TPA: hypothetical protein VMV52_04320 [Candidatus Nanopelagicaceae bacterium]|nr:hypothetical protein [Candidatus Nanopelagicaceae bacterium]